MSRPTVASFVITMLIVAAIGFFFGAALTERGNGAIGIVYAWTIFTPLFAFQQAEFFAPSRQRIARLPTAAYFAVELVGYVAIILLACAVAGTGLWLTGVAETGWREAVMPPKGVLPYSLAASLLTIFIMRLRDLVGRDVFVSLLTSRYRTPLREERIFLFFDLVGSTSFAERHGDLRAQQYLGEIFRVMADPVRRYRGSIDDYIGDSAIISWHFDTGARQAACIRCALGVFAALRADPDWWIERFGEVPQLRAALHGGPVITAEIGVDHHKITYFGDTVNTTARLESLCRTLEAHFLISADLLARIELPAGVDLEDKGVFNVRGRGQELAVAALSAETISRWSAT
jgi:adenylate cyclase